MTFDLRAQLLIDLGNWQKGLSKASKQAEGFGKSMKTISNGVKAAWAGVAMLGLNAVGDAIIEVTKLAAEDNKSTALLEEQIKRTWGNKTTITSINAQIDAMSNVTAIVDDKLRPALIRIAAVTKSPAKGMKYLSLATDIAAKSGQDLNLVSRNFAKFLGGNKTALDKLVPGLSKSGDRMKFLNDNYKGFAVIAGNNDPFSKISNTMENFKEKLGTAFLPVIQKFSDWLNSPEAQGMLDELAAKVQKFGEWFASPAGQKTFDSWMENLKTMITLAGKFLGLVGDVAKLLDPKSDVNNMYGNAFANADPNGRHALDFSGVDHRNLTSSQRLLESGGNMAPIYISVDPIDGKISRLLKSEAQKKGTTLRRLLGG